MKKIIYLLLIALNFLPFIYAEQSASPQQTQAPHMEGLAPGEPMPALPQSPLYLTGTTPEQLDPDYWIDRLPNPDQVLKTPEQLKFFNHEIHMMIKEAVDVFAPGALAASSQIKSVIKSEYETVSNRKLFNIKDTYIPKSFPFASDIAHTGVDFDVLADGVGFEGHHDFHGVYGRGGR